ncbi:MAG: Vps54-like protein-domain-containing protein [Monoraphidium minutum]|nr:MAG: Vps54-like protein-domain-containing protein [Monoraphidium minutum]
MLLKMLDDYMALYDIVPQFGAEIVHRELELLKQFNSQACQLVLGAGAMRTAGLRSISAKQLALSCQCVGMLAALHPLLRAGALALVSQPRRALLIPEFDRLLTDLSLHTDEIHSKLVDIMRDRLAAAAAALPAELQQVTVNPGDPSPSVATLARQLMTLRAVLTPLLLKEELEYIFGAIVRAFSETLAETLEAMVARGGAWEPAVRGSALYMLQAFRTLPIDPVRGSSYSSRLSIFYAKHFGPLPVDRGAGGRGGGRAAAAAAGGAAARGGAAGGRGCGGAAAGAAPAGGGGAAAASGGAAGGCGASRAG